MNYSEIKTYDIANGIGVRTSIFVSGCKIRCKDCFNSEAWEFGAGNKFDDNTMTEILKSLDHDYIEGLSILGGEPFEPENQQNILDLIEKVKEVYPNKTVWMWTGFYLEHIMVGTSCRANTPTAKDILKNIDVLVDGPFEVDNKDLMLRFRGSSNQRIIDIKKSISENRVVLWEDDPIFDKHEWTE